MAAFEKLIDKSLSLLNPATEMIFFTLLSFIFNELITTYPPQECPNKYKGSLLSESLSLMNLNAHSISLIPLTVEVKYFPSDNPLPY